MLGKQLLLNRLIQDNLVTLSRYRVTLTLYNTLFAKPQVVTGNPAYDTSIEITSLADNVKLGSKNRYFYNRLPLSYKIPDGEVLEMDTAITLRNVIIRLNEEYGTSIDQDEVQSYDYNYDTGEYSLTMKSDSIVWVGSKTITLVYVGGDIPLAEVIMNTNLNGLSYEYRL